MEARNTRKQNKVFPAVVLVLVLIGLAFTIMLRLSGSIPAVSFLPEPTPVPTPEPTPVVYTYDGAVVDASTASISLRADSDLEELAALAEQLPGLKVIAFGSREPKAEELELLRAAFPAAELQYSVRLGGRQLPWDTEELDLSSLTRAEVDEAVAAVRQLEKLRYVDLGAASEENADALTFEDVRLFQQARPETDFDFAFSLFGVELTTLAEEMNFKGIKMDDEGEAVRSVLPCMTRCTTLDMDNCGVSNETMAAIRDEYPDIKVIWRVFFGPIYGARTDVTKILATELRVYLYSEDVEVLKYCTEVKYLDLGHNKIDDISFVSYMPDLEVAILAINEWSDCTPLASCKNLEYLEIFNTKVTDLSPLAELTNLKHLNVCYLKQLEDVTPLYGLTNLERLWLGYLNKVPKEQKDMLKELLPNCYVNVDVGEPTGGGWRDDPRYDLLREQFAYDQKDYSYNWK